MQSLRRIFDFYLQASVHVALSVFALIQMTQHQFSIESDINVALFGFFGTIAGYNFVKYDALARVGKEPLGNRLKLIALFSMACLVAAGWSFLHLNRTTQILGCAFLLLTMLYTLPFFPNRRNARNWAGIKIYIVALCWVGVTLVLPVLDAGLPVTLDFVIKCIQRFLLIFTLVLIFEIIDLQTDDPHLQTVPQRIGVTQTKLLGYLLLITFYALELLLVQVDKNQLVINLLLIITIALFLKFAQPNRSRYYTAFWAESIPIFWWLMMLQFHRWSCLG